MNAADVVLPGLAIVALAVLAVVLIGTIWNRYRPRPHGAPVRRIKASAHMRSTCGVLVPVAEARPRHWAVDLGAVHLVVSWNARDYLVPRSAVPRGFADHLRPVEPTQQRRAVA